LVIAGTEPLDSIFRSVCRYPDVVPESVRGNPESVSDVELVQQARAVLDRYYADKLAELHALFERRAGQNRTSSDVATVARLVTQGAVDTLFVDIDGVVLGEVDEEGAVRFGDEQVPGSIGVVDEIARRGWLSGARACSRSAGATCPAVATSQPSSATPPEPLPQRPPDQGRQTWPPLSWCQYGNSGARSGDRADLARIGGGTQ
jgi:Bacterial archaeo-eukaryotic release factor family 11